MHMRRARMRDGFAGMAVGVEMDDAVVAVAMEMQTLAPQPPQQMRAKPDQHDADRRLERPRQTFRDGVAKQDGRAGKDKQRQRMAQSPGQPMLDDVADLAAARRDRGDGGDVIGLQRMLHAEQKTETQNTEH